MDIKKILKIYEKELIKKEFAEKSKMIYLNEVKQFLEYLVENKIKDLKEIDKNIVNCYQNYIFYKKTNQGKLLHSSTQIRKLVIIKSFLQTMTDLNLILFNPANDIELPREEKRLPKNILKFKEIERLESKFKEKYYTHFRNKLIIEILYTTGIRISELTNIKLNDIDFEKEILQIDKGKGKRSRTIPLLPELINKINEYIKNVRPKLLKEKTSQCLMINIFGEKYKSKCSINYMIKLWCKKTGIKKNITSHNFRSSFATELLKNGASIRHIQKLLGHKKLRTTQIYTEVSIEDLKKVHSKFHPFEKEILK